MCVLLASDKSDILRQERLSGPSEANKLFVKKMLESDNAGWFSEFVSALQNAGKYFVFNKQTHTEQLISRASVALLMIHDKAAYFPLFSILISAMAEKSAYVILSVECNPHTSSFFYRVAWNADTV